MAQSSKERPIWPRYMPILTASDLCRKDGAGGKRLTLLDWGRFALSRRKSKHLRRLDLDRRDALNVAGREVMSALNNALPLRYQARADHHAIFCDMESIESYNKDTTVPLRKIAAVWNRAVSALGYTEVTND